MIEQTVNLEAVKSQYKEARAAIARRVIVCAGTGCVANGSLKVFAALQNEIAGRGLDVVVELGHDCGGDVLLTKSGCQGFCQAGPLVTIEPEDYLYVHVKADDVVDIEASLDSGTGIVMRSFEPSDAAVGMSRWIAAFHKRDAFRALQKRLPEYAVTWNRAAAFIENLVEEVRMENR